ncbi:unnamed protein product, partial [Prunus brigantina]
MHVYSLGAQNIKKVSVTQSQPEPQTGRIQGTAVNLIRTPSSARVRVPKKLMGQLSSMLTKPKATDKIRRQPGCLWTSSYPKATYVYLGTCGGL